ncbi:TPA: hypothetical protein ACQ98W_002966 [Citrobacter braakii]|nr:hypothetical protein [Citrobacter braakii]
MKRSDSPSKQPKPFGINGQREDILPTTPSGDNSASFESGFPPITMTLKSSGGLPPKGQNMNQILYELSALSRWSSAGVINTFDESFATSVGGYAAGSLVISDDLGKLYISTVDENNNNPNSNPTGWLDALSYLRLGAGAPAIGIPFFWPSAVMPNTVIDEWSDMVFLKFNNSTFSATTYPKLALVYPGLTLTDHRGEFIRIWDDGRGVDSGRALLSAQDASSINLLLGENSNQAGLGQISVLNDDGQVVNSGWSVAKNPWQINNSDGANFAKVRPRNIAWNFLVRAK